MSDSWQEPINSIPAFLQKTIKGLSHRFLRSNRAVTVFYTAVRTQLFEEACDQLRGLAVLFVRSKNPGATRSLWNKSTFLTPTSAAAFQKSHLGGLTYFHNDWK